MPAETRQTKEKLEGAGCWGDRPLYHLLSAQLAFQPDLEEWRLAQISYAVYISERRELCALDQGKHVGPAGRGDLEHFQGLGKDRMEVLAGLTTTWPPLSFSARVFISPILRSRVELQSIMWTVAVTCPRHQVMLSLYPLQIPQVEGQGSPCPSRHTGHSLHTLSSQVWVSRDHWSSHCAGLKSLEVLLAEVRSVSEGSSLGQAKGDAEFLSISDSDDGGLLRPSNPREQKGWHFRNGFLSSTS